MNLTLSIDDTTVAKARKAAEAQGTSVQELVRGYLRDLAGEGERDLALARLQAGWASGPGHSAGYMWRRSDAYEGRSVLAGTFDGDRP